MTYGKEAVASVARGFGFVMSVVVLMPLVLFDYLRVVLSAAGAPGA